MTQAYKMDHLIFKSLIFKPQTVFDDQKREEVDKIILQKSIAD